MPLYALLDVPSAKWRVAKEVSVSYFGEKFQSGWSNGWLSISSVSGLGGGSRDDQLIPIANLVIKLIQFVWSGDSVYLYLLHW